MLIELESIKNSLYEHGEILDLDIGNNMIIEAILFQLLDERYIMYLEDNKPVEVERTKLRHIGGINEPIHSYIRKHVY